MNVLVITVVYTKVVCCEKGHYLGHYHFPFEQGNGDRLIQLNAEEVQNQFLYPDIHEFKENSFL